MKKQTKKKAEVTTKAMSYENAKAALATHDKTLRRTFDTYVVVGLRKRPTQEAVETGSEEVAMYYRNGSLTVIGCMVLDAYVSLYLEAISKMGVEVTDELRRAATRLVNAAMSEVSSSIKTLAETPSENRSELLARVTRKISLINIEEHA